MNGLVTIASELTGNAREFDINERIASFPTIYDTLWLNLRKEVPSYLNAQQPNKKQTKAVGHTN